MAKRDASAARVTRRALLIGTGGAVGLGIGFALWPRENRLNLPSGEGETILSAWVKLAPDGRLTVIVPQAEMGQGVFTGLPQILADELGADWSRIAVEPAPINPLYANRLLVTQLADGLPEALRGIGRLALRAVADTGAIQVTAGSSSVRAFEAPLRMAGAAARVLLCKAAARRWQVEWQECDTENGHVLFQANRIPFGELAREAARQSLPDELPLRSRREHPLAGRSLPRIDIPAKTEGLARFGADVRLPGMLFASIRQAPPGATVVSGKRGLGDGAAGVVGIVETESWVAVAAESWWQAEKAVELLEPQFRGGRPAPSDAEVEAALARALATDDVDVVATSGSEDEAAEPGGASGRTIIADYRVPYAAHGALETLTATARVTDGRVEVWAPTQSVSLARAEVARALGLSPDSIIIYPTFIGGSFGRKLDVSACAQAALIARALKRPVQLVWPRIEDMRHAGFRPAAAARMRGEIAGDGRLLDWTTRVAAPSASGELLKKASPGGRAGDWMRRAGDQLTGLSAHSATEGAAPLAYAAGSFRLEHARLELPVPLAHWRSNANSYTAFFHECFVDELAEAAGTDPLEYRIRHLAGSPRLRAALELAATRSGYAPTGLPQGLAVHQCYGSVAAQVAHVEAAADGQISVRRITCAVDCGAIVNPDVVRAQVEGGILFGLQAALYGGVSFAGGRVSALGLNPARTVTLATTPEIEVILMASDAPAGGVGELAVPPVGPAVANAVFAATGVRRRSLPLLHPAGDPPAESAR